MTETTENKIYSFSDFELDSARRTLTKDGEKIRLNSKTFDLLLALVGHRGEVLSKDQLLEAVWAGQFVEENNLTVHISALRKALGETKNEHRFIVTIPGRGYSFVHPLDEAAENEAEQIVVENHSFSRIVIEERDADAAPDFEEPNQPAPETNGAVRQIARAQSKKKLDFKSRAMLYFGSSAVFAALLALLYLANNGFLSRQQSAADFSNIKFTRLTASGKILNQAVSPDGKFVVFAQKEADGQSLWLRQIETGSQTRILESKPLDYIGLSVTPDGNYIYSTAFEANKADPVVTKIPVLGGAGQVLPFWTCIAVSFSPDGKQIAFNQPRSSLNESHLVTANADGSNFKILKRLSDADGSFPNYKTNSVAWSPNGGEIATIIEESSAAGGRTARLVGFNPIDASERSLSDKRWAFLWHLAWTGDGENLAVVGREEHSSTSQIWLVSRATGEARQITNDLNDYSFVATPKNSTAVYAIQRNVAATLQIADFDGERQTLEPRTILSESREFDSVAWSPSGEIFYSSFATGKREIWRVNPDAGDPTPLTNDSRLAFGFSVSPDGQKIAFNSWHDDNLAIWLADADGKNARRVTDGDEDINPRFAGNDRIVFQKGLNNKNITIWRVGLNGEAPVQLTPKHSTHPIVSSDGERVAYYFMDAENPKDNVWRIGLISTATGAFEGKLSFPKFITERRMAWHPSGSSVAQVFYEGEDINLLLLPVNGENAGQTFTNLGKGEISSLAWSHDGRSLAFSRHTETRDLVSLQNQP